VRQLQGAALRPCCAQQPVLSSLCSAACAQQPVRSSEGCPGWQVLGINLQPLLAVGGVGSLVVGLSAQTLLSNAVCGISLVRASTCLRLPLCLVPLLALLPLPLLLLSLLLLLLPLLLLLLRPETGQGFFGRVVACACRRFLPARWGSNWPWCLQGFTCF
jgi:hypothetical protein